MGSTAQWLPPWLRHCCITIVNKAMCKVTEQKSNHAGKGGVATTL